ncbi:MAG: rhomboid family intramembrane serine protease [Ahrensia sp.]|nr:rhomboid family intramembrane serine protease [Ahrensia sp.]
MQNESRQSDENLEEPSAVGSDQFPASPSQPLFNLPSVLIFLVVLCVAIHVLRTYILNPDWQIWLLVTFAYIPARFAPVYFQFDVPTFISPIVHTLLHGDWAHLGMNMIWLVAFGAPVAYRIGTVRSLLFWCITAVGAVLLHTAIYFGDSVPLIGASGAVSGFLVQRRASVFALITQSAGRSRRSAFQPNAVLAAKRCVAVFARMDGYQFCIWFGYIRTF